MTTIEILESYKILKSDAERLEVIYKELQDTIACGCSDNDGQPHGSNIGHPTEADAIRLSDAFLEYAEALNKASKRMLKIDRIIKSVPDWRGRYVLGQRYMRFRTLDDIGNDDVFKVCGRQVRRYHDEAIDYLDERLRYALSRKG